MVRAMLLAAVAGLVVLVPNAKADEKKYPVLMLEGTVTNQTVGKTDRVKVGLILTEDRKSIERAIGRFGNKNLFGEFDLKGQVVNASEGVITVRFSGELELGDDGSGFPKGTKVPFAMTLRLSNDGVEGTYRIDPLPSFGIYVEQKGTLDLTPVATKKR